MINRSPMEDKIDYIFNHAKDVVKNNTLPDNIEKDITFLTDLSAFLDRQALMLEQLKTITEGM